MSGDRPVPLRVPRDTSRPHAPEPLESAFKKRITPLRFPCPENAMLGSLMPLSHRETRIRLG